VYGKWLVNSIIRFSVAIVAKKMFLFIMLLIWPIMSESKIDG
jgi:nitrate reductase NapE component